jgi:uncharacterized protein YbaR (Trm112 family)
MATSDVSADLMAILRCPRCRGELVSRPGALGCEKCKLAFAVRDGVPNFLLEDAQPLPPGGSR